MCIVYDINNGTLTIKVTPWDIYQNMIDLGYVKSGKVGKTETTVPAKTAQNTSEQETKQEQSTDKTDKEDKGILDNLLNSGGGKKHQLATIIMALATAMSIIVSLFLYLPH